MDIPKYPNLQYPTEHIPVDFCIDVPACIHPEYAREVTTIDLPSDLVDKSEDGTVPLMYLNVAGSAHNQDVPVAKTDTHLQIHKSPTDV